MDFYSGRPRADPWLTNKDVNLTASAEMSATSLNRVIFVLRRAAMKEDKNHAIRKRLDPAAWKCVEAAIDEIVIKELCLKHCSKKSGFGEGGA